MSLPILAGWAAAGIMKRDDDTAEIPIIALTAHALSCDREKALEVSDLPAFGKVRGRWTCDGALENIRREGPFE
jgi:CheY-like chemotaxis protein